MPIKVIIVILFLLKVCPSFGKVQTYLDEKTQLTFVNGNGKIKHLDSFTYCDSTEFLQAVFLIIKGIRKYPPSLIKKRLNKIYIYKSFCRSNICYGGTYRGKDIYITYRDGIQYLENIFHHEFNSVLMLFKGTDFNKKEWLAHNPKEFSYWDQTEGIEYLKLHSTSIPSFEQAYLAEGFVSNYSKASFDNDLSRYAEAIFTANPAFWAAVDKYEAVRGKTILLINFYHKQDKMFTEEYFRQLK